jgi:hypothetical protein
MYEDRSDYELCSLYCDYHEWLETGSDIKPNVREKYENHLAEIMREIARRYKWATQTAHYKKGQ